MGNIEQNILFGELAFEPLEGLVDLVVRTQGSLRRIIAEETPQLRSLLLLIRERAGRDHDAAFAGFRQAFLAPGFGGEARHESTDLVCGAGSTHERGAADEADNLADCPGCFDDCVHDLTGDLTDCVHDPAGDLTDCVHDPAGGFSRGATDEAGNLADSISDRTKALGCGFLVGNVEKRPSAAHRAHHVGKVEGRHLRCCARGVDRDLRAYPAAACKLLGHAVRVLAYADRHPQVEAPHDRVLGGAGDRVDPKRRATKEVPGPRGRGSRCHLHAWFYSRSFTSAVRRIVRVLWIVIR